MRATSLSRAETQQRDNAEPSDLSLNLSFNTLGLESARLGQLLQPLLNVPLITLSSLSFSFIQLQTILPLL
jgi:hypothetical protein